MASKSKSDMTTAELMKLNLYDIIGVTSHEASEKEIRKSYRTRALKCHPDKNPDNPRAAEEFRLLSQALEILTDTPAKNAYDKVIKARHAKDLRDRHLDDKRKKLKLDLESRESRAANEERESEQVSATRNLEAEIRRLREEGSKQLKEEQEYLHKLTHEKTTQSNHSGPPRLKIKWKAPPPGAEDYSQEKLQQIFGKYGEITAVVISARKKRTAVIEYESAQGAMMAFNYEKGTIGVPLEVTWVQGRPPEQPDSTTGGCFTSEIRSDRDNESIVLMKLRQAEERKRLIEQMNRDDQS